MCYVKNFLDIIGRGKDEFGDGSEWTLSKCLTHANRTFNLIFNFFKSGVQVSIRWSTDLKEKRNTSIKKGLDFKSEEILS